MKKLKKKEDPQPIPEYALAERLLQHKEASSVVNIPDTITRSHPMILKDILKGKSLGTKSAKDVKKALKQKKKLVNSLVPTSEDL